MMDIDITYESARADLPEQFVPLVPCWFEQGSGDKRWPVLCQRDMKYATRHQCDTCNHRRP